ncbi:Integrase, superantigen-encoding pathogenicity islands SaPI [Clostridiaceae bacterium JG1575]|nr:Integrase, superantigen-encoding pathogenicity islands SaPI [Clostridiaceae bacterium JG1575]
MPAYKDEKAGTWYVSLYYKDWDNQSHKKMKRGFETKKEAVSYERNFTSKMSGSLNIVNAELKLTMLTGLKLTTPSRFNFDH